ncbi:MAG: bifunctional phosphoribosyl-AMP cyclohydrolase/phosphoribosyl-ATP diphosphatase HisIE [Solirubrobacterales bacterium]|nr:bifunctional phosphoribosyl-AMP cyclohydrolase/phosphoribosyl-ATP diphosphatase HisIE [Solirubrobacterales bacterium]
MSAAEVRFGPDGLLPCVMQDGRTGEVLTLAWMNREALDLTRQTGEMHFFSRSRQRIWHKGEESGNVQRVLQLRIDCDADAIVALVEPAGPACHTGERSCFYRDLETGSSPAPVPGEALATLARTIGSRSADRPEGSYVVRLLDDPAFAGEKVMEEAEEVSRAVREESDQRVAEEAADVLFHLTALIRSRGITLDQVGEVLNGRRA